MANPNMAAYQWPAGEPHYAPTEFMGLGAALNITGADQATVSYEDDGYTLVVTVPTASGQPFIMRWDLRYGGVRLFTELLGWE